MDRIYKLERIVKYIYCQIKNGSGGSTGVSPQVIVTDASYYQIQPTAKTIMLTLTGTSTDVELPIVEGNMGLIIFIKNAGELPSAVWSHPDDNKNLWEGGMDVESTNVAPGSVMRIINDGIQYSVL